MLKIVRRLNKRPNHIPQLEFRYFSLLRVVFLLALSLHITFLGIFGILGIKELTYVQFLSIGIFSCCLFLNGKRKYLLSASIGIWEVILHQTWAIYLIGWESQLQHYLFLCAVVPFLLPRGNNFAKTILLLSCVIAYVVIYYFIGQNPPKHQLSMIFLRMFGILSTAITGTFLGVFGLYFSNAMNKTQDELEVERKKTSDLLHNILPASIVERLKETDSIIADGFESVSVLFADIVGFTKLSAKLTPKELVVHLNDVFSTFDQLAEKYQLEKIKTIGDAYMISAGLPEVDPGHASKLAMFAIDMRDYMAQRMPFSGEKLQIRIGIHSGPAVAGVIGIKKFTYDLWGDTVNTASRMESHGLPGQIQVTEDFYKETADLFIYEKRAPIEVKGKGQMQTYFLIDNIAKQDVITNIESE